MRARSFLAAILVAAAAVAQAGCAGPNVDLTKGLQVLDVSSGWADLGIVEGQNKLVPSLTFTVKNTSSQPLNVLQVNVLFRRVNETEEWGSRFLTVAGSEGLAPGATSKVLVADSTQGYKGNEPRVDMLKNSQFIDAKAEVFAKYASMQWERLGEYPVKRQLLSR